MIEPRITYWMILVIITGTVFFLRFYWLPHTLNLVRGTVSAITGLCIALLIAGRIPFSNSLSKEKR